MEAALTGQDPRKKGTRGCSQFIEPNAPQTMAVAGAPNYTPRVPERVPEPSPNVACVAAVPVALLLVASGSGGEKASMLALCAYSIL